MELFSAWIFGTITGTFAGIACMALFKYYSDKRSLQRRHMAAYIMSMSRIALADTRRLFSKNLFPHWVVFGKREKVDWWNHEFSKAWPFLEKGISPLLMHSVESMLELYKTPNITSFKVPKFSLGSIPPQISGVELVESHEGEVVLEFDIQWSGEPNITLLVKVSGITVAIQIYNFVFIGTARLIVKPLSDEIPCFGAISCTLWDLRTFNFDQKMVSGNIAPIPGLQTMIEGVIKTAISDSLLWPMRHVIRIHAGDYRDLELRVVGTLFVKLVEGRNLLNKDIIGKSDPFALLYLRPIPGRIKRSRTINNDLCPVWNEKFVFEVEDPQSQSLFIKVLDEEGVQEPEFLGCAKVEIKALTPGKFIDMWIPLKKDFDSGSTKYRGDIHLELCYAYGPDDVLNSINCLSLTKKSLQRPMTVVEKVLSSKEVKSVDNLLTPISFKENSVVRGILSLTVIRGEGLAKKKQNGPLNPYVQVKLKKSEAIMRTKVIPKTSQPEWNERFDLLIENALHEMMVFEVLDHRTFRDRVITKQALTLTFLLRQVGDDIEIKLQGSAAGKIYIRVGWAEPAMGDPNLL